MNLSILEPARDSGPGTSFSPVIPRVRWSVTTRVSNEEILIVNNMINDFYDYLFNLLFGGLAEIATTVYHNPL